jgi:DNA-binding transcriptional regulator YiaG
MPTLTTRKPKGKRKPKPKPTPAGPTLGQRLLEGMDEVLAHVRGQDTDVLSYTLPPNATLAQVRTARRAAEKKLRAKQVARRERLTVAPFAPADVYALRRCLGVGSECLADFLNVPHALVEAWEDGTKAPAGAALRLLADIRARPDYWRDQLHAATGDAP